jgi:two-component system KDP operon response regulator KdpE
MLRRASILLVDDDPQVVRALVPALEVNGAQVTVANCGLSAIEQSQLTRWDAAVVDLGLPDMDGQDLVRYLAQDRATPVMVISAQHSEHQVQTATRGGALHFLHKPFPTPELVNWLKTMLAAPVQPSQN